jgi:hypothetical protein
MMENLTATGKHDIFYFYFIRCSINTDDYTSARTDKINSQNKYKINMYIYTHVLRLSLELPYEKR